MTDIDLSTDDGLDELAAELQGEVRFVPAQGGGERPVVEFETIHAGTGDVEKWWVYSDSRQGTAIEGVPHSYNYEDRIEGTGNAVILASHNEQVISVQNLAEYEVLIRGDEGTMLLNVPPQDPDMRYHPEEKRYD